MRILVALALLALSPAAQSVVEFSAARVRATLETPWPTDLSGGYAPVFVRFDNDGTRDRLVEIEAEAEAWRGPSRRVISEVIVPRDGSVRHELLVPVHELEGEDFTFEFKIDQEKVRTRWDPGGLSPYGCSPVLVITAGDPGAGRLLDWTQALSDEVYTVGGETIYDTPMSAVAPGDLPGRFEAYTSLSAIVVNTSTLDPTELPESIVAFARLGGVLALVGRDPEGFARRLPGVSSWLEERFRLEGVEGSFQLAHGTLLVGADGELLGDNDIDALHALLNDRPGYVPSKANQPKFLRLLPIPDLAGLPFRAFVLFIIAFTVLVGPVNFMLVKQSGRPAWLLVTIPLLAAGAVVAILAYGILYQGVDLKESEQVYTLLDQREHLADSVEVRSFFAGLAPTDGLRPGARSAVFPHHYYSSGNSSPVFVLDLRERPVLSGEFLPVRREGHHVVVSEQAARGRLSFERQDADRIACQNGLEVELASLLVADAEGELYAWMPAGGELLAPGQRVELARVLAADDLPLHTWMPAPIDGRDLGWSRDPFDRPQLPPSTYVARAGASIYADDTGLVPDVVTGEHVVLGVLPLAEEEWR